MATNKRKCKECKKVFEKKQPLQYVCSPICAINYAKKKKIDFELIDSKERKTVKKSYADNFLR